MTHDKRAAFDFHAAIWDARLPDSFERHTFNWLQQDSQQRHPLQGLARVYRDQRDYWSLMFRLDKQFLNRLLDQKDAELKKARRV